MEEKRQRIEARKAMMAPTTSTKSAEKPKEDKKVPKKATTPKKEELKKPELKIEVHATATHHEAEKHLEPKVAHSQSHEFSHGQAVSLLTFYYNVQFRISLELRQICGCVT